ncbi:MAG: aldo/keto reductase [Candidatus Izimaplasma sp.]|nr:aldo/keto reductase [Candidatus Izimaplasma bacterium]
MEYKKTKRFDKKISRIGFGAWQLGNTKEFTKMTINEGVKLVKDARAKGITFFDTAPNYGGGRSEEILGIALKDDVEEVHINTKVGHSPQDEFEFSLEDITASIKRSLNVLNRDYIDSVILHSPGMDILQGDAHYKHFEMLKKQGLIKGYGVSIDTLEELKVVLDKADVDVIEIMYNIFHQGPSALFDEVNARDILLIIKVPLDSGWLTGKYHAQSTFTGIRSRWTKDDITRRAELVRDVKEIVGDENLVSYALAFILKQDAVTTVIPGIRNHDQLDGNIDALTQTLTPKQLEALTTLYETKIKPNPLPW